MGNRFKSQNDVLDQLFQHLCRLREDWALYRALFDIPPERVTLLNRRTGYVFRRLQLVLGESVLLQIAKLLDMPEVAGRENLSLRRALSESGLATTDARYAGQAGELDLLEKQSGPIRSHRNKLLAHIDLDAARGEVQLPRIEVSLVADTIQRMERFYNQLHLLCKDGTVLFRAFDNQVRPHVQVLMRVLEAGNTQLDIEEGGG